MNITAPLQKTLLCVDDEANVLRSLQRLFRAEGFRVLTAENSTLAFDLLEKESIQVVMADQRMPDMSGTKFLQQVKQRYPDAIRVVLSGYSEVNAILEAINRGEIYRFLGKPWDDEELKVTINQCFEHYSLLSENGRLLAQLQQKNNALNELNSQLENAVEVRTQALQLTQNIIEFLPLPILGVSAEGLVVLANAMAGEYLKTIARGETIEGMFSVSVQQLMQQYFLGEVVERKKIYCEQVNCWLQLVSLKLDDQVQGCLVILGGD